jgi:hypothetical protein
MSNDERDPWDILYRTIETYFELVVNPIVVADTATDTNFVYQAEDLMNEIDYNYHQELDSTADTMYNISRIITHLTQVQDMTLNDTVEAILNIENPNNFEDVKVTLSTSDFEKLSDSIAENQVLKTEDCNICLETIGKRKALKLNCSHSFHTKCLKKWLTSYKTSCPCCRTDCRDYL